MSFKSLVKQKVMKCLIHKCDREYDRTYRYAQKSMSYSNLIAKLEAEHPISKERNGIRHALFTYMWEQPLDIHNLKDIADKADVVLLCDKEIYLHVNAIEYVCKAVESSPESLIWYGDEDSIDEYGQRDCPWLKPDWSPVLFSQVFYLGGVFAVRSALLSSFLDEVQKREESEKMTIRDLGTCLCKVAGGFETGTKTIEHINAILCHQPSQDAYKKYFFEKANEVEMVRMSACDGKPLVSIIIPSKDHFEILQQNLKSLEKTVVNSDAEIVIVDNGSDKETKTKIEKLIQELSFQIKYIYNPMEFNFSAMCNMGAREAKGRFILFLNDDIEAAEDGWLDRMVQTANISYVGCVGAKLLYPNSWKIQHVGVMNLPDGPVHKLQFLDDSIEYYFGKNRYDAEALAVTGACLMIKADLFWKVGGFDEELPVTFNDIDLCYKMYANGFYNVCLNSIYLYHHESLSRGMDETDSKRNRLKTERDKLWRKHCELMGRDPFYNRLLHRHGSDTSIRPALEEHLPTLKQQCDMKTYKDGMWKDTRRHEGVLCGIDVMDVNRLKGYIVMIGDDNACYEKAIMLRNKETKETYWCKVESALREDVKKNLPDQKNVGLCGFDIEIKGCSAGEYEILVAAYNKISRVLYWKETMETVTLAEG